MPVVQGYSRDAISRNIRREVRLGRPQAQAIAIALDEARRAYRERHPTGPLPRHLAQNRRRNPARSGLDVGTLLLVGFGAWLALRGRTASAPHLVAPQPEAPDPGPCADRPEIPYQQWWERYLNNNQPAPADRVFPDALVPDCPAGPQYASLLAASEGIPAHTGLFG